MIAHNDDNAKYSQYKLSKALNANIRLIRELFNQDNTLIISEFTNRTQVLECAIAFINGMADEKLIREAVVQPIAENSCTQFDENRLSFVKHQIRNSKKVDKISEISEILQALIAGNTILFLEGADEALVIDSIWREKRAISEPEGEKVLRGPREGFTESLTTNLSLVRKRLLTPDLKYVFREIGERTNTRICICYIDGIVNNKILEELYRRLDAINIDGILESEYIQELIKDAPLSPFKTIGSTERPDIVAAKLLEGRIAIIVEGTPVALTLPHVFIEYFQANEDYYLNFYFSSINRIIRILGFLTTISVPAIYTALVTFHQELIPTPLAISIAASKEGVPFPTTVEALALLLVFEILRETGTRMPSFIGQALSIVGALVIGQAAIEARFVSAPIVIVVAFAGITGLMTPRIKGAAIMLRTLFLILSSILGLFGYIFGMAGLMLHLFELRSFGVPYMLGATTLDPSAIKDAVIRAPWWYMKYRLKFIAANSKRMRNGAGNK